MARIVPYTISLEEITLAAIKSGFVSPDEIHEYTMTVVEEQVTEYITKLAMKMKRIETLAETTHWTAG